MTTLVKPTPSNYFVRGWSTAGSGHRGIDYGYEKNNVENSTKILAAADGVVIDVYTGSGYNQGWGRRIRIDHGHGNITTYNHIRPGGVLVTAGESVHAGQPIGLMGSSGATTGTHLHFELYLNGKRVDPQPYFQTQLPGTGTEAPTPPPAVPSTGSTFTVPGKGQYYYWKYENALSGNYSNNQLLAANQTLEVVENPGTGPVRVRCKDGDLVWVGTRKNPAVVNGGSPAPAPSPQVTLYFDVPSNGQYYYSVLANALNGKYSKQQLIPGNTGALVVVEDSGQGPVKVRWNNSDVWVGTRKNPAAVRRG